MIFEIYWKILIYLLGASGLEYQGKSRKFQDRNESAKEVW